VAKAYGVFVVTPPPSETIPIGHAKTRGEAKALAMKWASGGITWQGADGITNYGEKVIIEEIKIPTRKGKALDFLHWDEFFETGVFERYMAPELGYSVNQFGEVEYGTPEREGWNKIWEEASRWLLWALERREIHAYSLQGKKMYIQDIKDIIEELKAIVEERDPREWVPRRHEWEMALASGLEKLLDER